MRPLLGIVPFRATATLLVLFCVAIAVWGGVLVAATGYGGVWAGVVLVDLVLLLMLPLLVLLNRPYVADLNNIAADLAWAHWTYTPAEWRAANRLEGRRELRAAALPVLTTAVFGLVLLLFGVNSGVAAGLGGFMLSLSLALAIALVVGGTGVVGRTRSQGEAFVTPVGVHRSPGGYIPMFGLRMALKDIELTTEGNGSFLRFETLAVRTTRGVGASRRSLVKSDAVRLLVPADRLDEARDLVARYHSELLQK